MKEIIESHPGYGFVLGTEHGRTPLEDKPDSPQAVIMNHNIFEIESDFSYFKFTKWLRTTLAETSILKPYF